jgi:Uma2 family endonuclease
MLRLATNAPFQHEHPVGMLAVMRTVIVGTRPAELDALIASRRARGLDLYDEVWKGDYHMNPAPHARHGDLDFQLPQILGPLARSKGLFGKGIFNLGTSTNYRVPDVGFTATRVSESFVPTAALVIEIVSPGDESFDKLPHYAEFGVEEVIIIDPDTRSVRIFRGTDEVDTSTVLGFTAAWLTEQLDWPD